MSSSKERMIQALAEQHIAVPVVECSCLYGPETVHENVQVGWVCSFCCDLAEDGSTGWCERSHEEYHHVNGRWSSFYCPVIQSVESIEPDLSKQESMDALAQGFREALWEVKDMLATLPDPIHDDASARFRRKAIAEVDALLADAVSE